MDAIIMGALALATGTALVLEIIKKVFEVNTKYFPLISVITGIVVAIATYFVPEIRMELSIPALIVAGAISGASASGMYDLVAKNPKNTDNPKL